MKQKRFLTFGLVCLILFMQIPFTAFAAETDIRAELLSPATLPSGRVEIKYNVQFYFDYSKFDGGYQAYSWSIEDSELPPGLELKSQHSTWQPVLQGTPTEAGTYTFTIKGGRTDYINGENVPVIAARKTYTLTILPAYPLQISNNTLYNGYENQSYSLTLDEERYRTVLWSMELADGGALPDGLSINKDSGEIAWESPVAGKYNLKITASRDNESVSKILKLIIEAGDGCKHTGAIKTTRKAATCKENGLADFWYCDECERYYIDAEFKREVAADGLDNLYTVGFHSDKNNDGNCDTCQKAMPIFTKVTNASEITSCGMYLVVSKINDKYYTLKAPEGNYIQSIDAVEITPNTDGTFSYPETDTDIMILKTEFAAECGDLDAGLPRYSLGTVLNNIPYGVQSDGSTFMLYSYENNKYGYRINLTDDKYAEIASVYSEYWSESGWDGRYILSASSTQSEDNSSSVSFCLASPDTAQFPIELYKLVYAGTANNKSYTLSDAQSLVTIDNAFTVSNSDGNKLSTVGGISEAVKTGYVEEVISAQADIADSLSVRTYANINLKSEENAVNDWNETIINSLVYEITPKLEIKGTATSQPVVKTIDDKNFDGSKMTLSLCVGNMNPVQIIHHKADGTKEYFYEEHSAQVKKGAKSFSFDPNYSQKGNFVTFSVDSFSDIEILATAKSEKDNEIIYSNGVLKATVAQDGNYTLILSNSADKQLSAIKVLYPTLSKGENTISDLDGFTLTNNSKIFLWKNLETAKPVCEALNVTLK